MLTLIVFVLIALVFSFACSIFEAVLLSINDAYVALLVKEGKKSGEVLRKLRADIGKPLSAILSLNTIAHTIGAAGAGAQAAVVFGDAYLGIASAILTLLILVFSEIIPKTLGANYWRQLAPFTAFSLRYLLIILYPFVLLSEWITRFLGKGKAHTGLSIDEFKAMAEVSQQDGLLNEDESRLLKNLLAMRELRVADAMTPRTVIFSLPQHLTCQEYLQGYAESPFSRIPVYEADPENIIGFVRRSEILASLARDENKTLGELKHHLPSLLKEMPLNHVLKEMQQAGIHIMLVVNEYGGVEGLITLEDVLETILGMEFIDETDQTVDMQRRARLLWHQRAARMGITDLKSFEEEQEAQ